MILLKLQMHRQAYCFTMYVIDVKYSVTFVANQREQPELNYIRIKYGSY